ncbi:unnamed protein product [Prorocentrum cordatum]|uniref:Uncharacterized protein n=1 Tax=Prorocentrum cordatum TaxID=2364126 RepID=A0ABN9W9F0_9DINO|nr:unnamed protein product [Polarella glacialis]
MAEDFSPQRHAGAHGPAAPPAASPAARGARQKWNPLAEIGRKSETDWDVASRMSTLSIQGESPAYETDGIAKYPKYKATVLYHLRDPVSESLQRALHAGSLQPPFEEMTVIRGKCVNRYVMQRHVVAAEDIRADFDFEAESVGCGAADTYYKANGFVLVRDPARALFHGCDPKATGFSSMTCDEIAAAQEKYVLNEPGNRINYERNVEGILRSALAGVEEVVIFDHTVRCDSLDDNDRIKEELSPQTDAGQQRLEANTDAVNTSCISGVRPPAAYAHGDYSVESAARRIDTEISGGNVSSGSSESQRRSLWREAVTDDHFWHILNVWRPLDYAAERTPLAFIHPESVDESRDWIMKPIQLPDRVGQLRGYLSPLEGADGMSESARNQHRWTFVPRVGTDEAWIFCNYDSRMGGVGHSANCTPWVGHSGLDVEGTRQSRPRRSIETRAMVRFRKS